MTIREITPADIPALFAVRVATHENRLTRDELAALGITEQAVRARLWLTTDVDPNLKAYRFYRQHGWMDERIERGLRYMVKPAVHAAPAAQPRSM